jgi:hypothetical protein
LVLAEAVLAPVLMGHKEVLQQHLVTPPWAAGMVVDTVEVHREDQAALEVEAVPITMLSPALQERQVKEIPAVRLFERGMVVLAVVAAKARQEMMQVTNLLTKALVAMAALVLIGNLLVLITLEAVAAAQIPTVAP